MIAIGRLKPGPELSLVEDYANRLKPAPAQLGPLGVIEIDERKGERSIVQSVETAIAGLAAGTRLIALDERGEHMTTRQFADQLAAWRDQGVPEVGFLIGGPDGLDDGLLRKAERKLSLGRMTWPHRLARAMLAEQLYRAASLLAGHPYHRE